MNTEYTRKVLEAALLAAGRSLTVTELAQLFDAVDRPEPAQLLETAQGFRFQVRREFSDQVARLWPERPPRYSRALLETLAIIAYRQPLTRAEIEAVRGVAVNPNIVKTLFERAWIRVVGHREVPGRPELLGTTRDFLDYFGLKALDDLPPLAELKSLEDLDPQLALPEPIAALVTVDEPEAEQQDASQEAANDASTQQTVADERDDA
jgi:segregation and condensation protein B